MYRNHRQTKPINYIKNSYFNFNYLDTLPKRVQRIMIAFRMSNRRLPVETGRWHSTCLEDRYCTPCYLTTFIKRYDNHSYKYCYSTGFTSTWSTEYLEYLIIYVTIHFALCILFIVYEHIVLTFINIVLSKTMDVRYTILYRNMYDHIQLM